MCSVDFKSSKPHKNMTTDTVKQGPMRLVDLMDRLATEDNVSRDFAAKTVDTAPMSLQSMAMVRCSLLELIQT